MDDQHAVIASLRNAVSALPDDIALRMHLARLLLTAGHPDEAVTHLGAILQADPANSDALTLLASQHAEASPAAEASAAIAASPAHAASPAPAVPRQPDGFDWAEAEAELSDVLPPMFITPEGASADDGEGNQAAGAFDAERPGLVLADVAGMTEVKARLEAAFLAPMRNPELRKLYGKSLRGGLLLYGPPGCGKTFIARAVAGELGARFMAVSFADVVDMYVGSSERNIHEIFETARENSPCVIFLDEVDAIGQKRSQLRSTPMRSAVNQLLLELDDVTGGNDGVFVLAATNHPWDIDSALRRPGRLDRTLLVLPPDEEARAAVFRYHLRDRPVAGIQLAALAGRTDGYSGADIAHICESAAELALLDSARTGQVRLIGQDDLLAAVRQVRPSLGPWFESARNVALFANDGGYDDLAAYLKKRKML
ncbi:MAG TPA: tetratricopeptide repeat protein [Streptosporangiaceae bacterium]|nr:tetratricopeptide repeat protein [Streptosporangiaceae bacterium]